MSYTGDGRVIIASGVAGGIDGSERYAYTNTPSASFAAFNGTVSGVAHWEDTTPWYPGLEPGSYHAESGASQNSGFSGSSLFSSSRIWGSDWVSQQGPYGPASPVASSVFRVSFELATTVQYELTVGYGPAISTWAYYDRGTPSLFAVPQTQLLLSPEAWNNQQYQSGYRYQGVLEPGAYTLLFTQGFGLPADPFGQSLDASAGMNFTVTAVPEPSVAALIGMGLIALLHRRRCNRA